MSYTYVQSAIAVAASVTLGSASSAGDSLFLGVTIFQAGTVTPTASASDNVGNTYTQCGAPVGPVANLGFNTYTFLFYATNIHAGTITATAAISGTGFAGTVLSEYTPSPASALTLDTGSYVTLAGSSLSAATFSTTFAQSNELLICVAEGSGSNSAGGAGWTTRAMGGGFDMLLADNLSGPAAGPSTQTAFNQSAGALGGILAGFFPFVPGPSATTAVFPLPVYRAIGIL